MGIPIGELQQRISGMEFAEYWAYYTLEPFGPERDDIRSGIVASTIANANRDPKRQPKAFTPDQFIPKFVDPVRDDEETLDADEVAAKARGLVEALGGVVPADGAERTRAPEADMSHLPEAPA